MEISSNLEKFPFLECASGNRALNFMGNFQEIFGNLLETVRVVIGQESVRVGMWSRFLSKSQISEKIPTMFWRVFDAQTAVFATK